MSKISEPLKELVEQALRSHETCAHFDIQLCSFLIMVEVEVLHPENLTEEEYGGCIEHIANLTLESLILKGIVEARGIDESGDFLIGLTEEGERSFEEIKRALEKRVE